MNDAHWHLVVNHLPIVFPMAAFIALAAGIISKSEAVKRTAYLLFIVGAATAFAAMATGEGAEEVVEHLNGVSENYIETHEEAAETFALLSYILGGLSIVGLWASVKNKSFAKLVSIVVLLFALVALFFAKAAGTTGGEIRHTEIRDGSVQTGHNAAAEAGHDDD